jgi:hypothetical protein
MSQLAIAVMFATMASAATHQRHRCHLNLDSSPIQILPRIIVQPIFSTSDNFSERSIISIILLALVVLAAARRWVSCLSFPPELSIDTILCLPTMSDHLSSGAKFFVEWPLWADLGLVGIECDICAQKANLFQILACSAVCSSSFYISVRSDLGQVIVTVLGVAIKIKHHIRDERLRMRETEDEATRVEKGEILHSNGKGSAFGIEALLEEPEVEGVWHSRGNSLQSNDGSEQMGSSTELSQRAEPPTYTRNLPGVSSDAVLVSPAGMMTLNSTSAAN